MRHWRPGVRVNMETDLIGKYVRSLLGPWSGQTGPSGKDAGSGAAAGKSPGHQLGNQLLRNGFI